PGDTRPGDRGAHRAGRRLTGRGDPVSLYRGATYADLIVTALRRYPRRTAFVQGDRRLTYAEAADRIGRIAAVLRSRGLGRGECVAVLSPNRPEAWFAD